MPPDDKLQGQEIDVFERAYVDHLPRVLSFLRIYLKNVAAADDVAQETFLQFWMHPHRFDSGRATLKAYLLGIAQKKAADWHRRKLRDPEARKEPTSDVQNDTLALQDVLDRLDPDLRNILWLREVEGYSYEELAEILKVPIGTVRSRLFTARERIRSMWNERSLDDLSGR